MIRYRNIMILILMVLATVASCLADGLGTLKGRIIDRETKEPIVDVGVIVVPSEFGVVTDINGNFNIDSVKVGRRALWLMHEDYNTPEVSYPPDTTDPRTMVSIFADSTTEIVIELDRLPGKTLFPPDTNLSGRLMKTTLGGRYNRFGFDLFKALNDKRPEDNVTISPVSIAMALGLARLGARNQTLDEINRALYFTDLSDSRAADLNTRLLAKLLQRNLRGKLKVANSLWLKSGYPFISDYVKNCQNVFRTTPYSFRTDDPTAIDRINHWIDSTSEGTIPSTDIEIDSTTVALLINTLYFQCNWYEKFDSNRTAPAPFITASGDTVIVPMMDRFASHGPSKYYACREFQLLSLDFLEPLEFVVIFESPDVDSSWLRDNLTYANWIHWKGKLRYREGRVRMPRTKLDIGNKMVETLQALGIKLAFDTTNADFHNMADYAGDTCLYISDFDHKTSVEINEQGVIAGAASAVEMGSGDSIPIYPPFLLELNRPFYFLIVDNDTDAILFMGHVTNPGQS